MRLAAAAATAATVLALAGCDVAVTTSSVQYLPVPPAPPTVAQVAAQLHATGAVDCPGAGAAVGVVHAGTAHLHGVKIGIDVFPDTAVRDAWKAASAGIIVPMAQGADWVIYEALSQTGTECS
jgi:hypothetical protein